jgi:hypothetical protein
MLEHVLAGELGGSVHVNDILGLNLQMEIYNA